LTSRRLLVLLALATCAGAANAATVRSDVYLVQGEGLKPVARQLSQKTVRLAVESLLRGPTAAETKVDVRTQIPTAARVRSVTVRSGIATIDLTRPFVHGTNRASLLGRLVQLVWTATAVPGVTGVRVWIDGKQAKSIGQGVSVERTLTRANVDPPNEALYPPTSFVPDAMGPGSAGGATTKWIQQRLVALGYLPSKAVTGHLGQYTKSAVLAFQGWEKLQRDAVPGPQTVARLRVAKRPVPAAGSGKRIEVHLTAQVAFLDDGPRVTRVIKVSTGAPGFATPTGSYRIYRKHPRDWSYPYSVWLPFASYFVGGIAFHESPSVPAYPASHGCVRVPRDDAPIVYAFAALHTPVQVVR
jgi:hypothetical protein